MHGVAAQDERRDQNDRPENRLAKKILDARVRNQGFSGCSCNRRNLACCERHGKHQRCL